MTKITAEELYNKLLDLHLENEKGNIYFDMAGINAKIKTTDTVGMTLQSWLKQYLIKNNYFFKQPKNTQEFPDFFLDDQNSYSHMLEIKSFNYEKTPGFDIANYDSYCSKIEKEPYCLYADYLIFGYVMKEGDIYVKRLWLKKIWQIAGTSERYALKTQVKRDKIYNIRPNSSFKKDEEGPFKNEIEFLRAVYDTIKKDKNKETADDWKKTLCENYKNYFEYPLLF